MGSKHLFQSQPRTRNWRAVRDIGAEVGIEHLPDGLKVEADAVVIVGIENLFAHREETAVSVKKTPLGVGVTVGIEMTEEETIVGTAIIVETADIEMTVRDLALGIEDEVIVHEAEVATGEEGAAVHSVQELAGKKRKLLSCKASESGSKKQENGRKREQKLKKRVFKAWFGLSGSGNETDKRQRKNRPHQTHMAPRTTPLGLLHDNEMRKTRRKDLHALEEADPGLQLEGKEVGLIGLQVQLTSIAMCPGLIDGIVRLIVTEVEAEIGTGIERGIDAPETTMPSHGGAPDPVIEAAEGSGVETETVTETETETATARRGEVGAAARMVGVIETRTAGATGAGVVIETVIARDDAKGVEVETGIATRKEIASATGRGAAVGAAGENPGGRRLSRSRCGVPTLWQGYFNTTVSCTCSCEAS
jgi:hypothetical protein